MPVFTDALRNNQAQLGLDFNPRVAEFWRSALHFVNRQGGRSLGSPFGLLLRGYGDIGMPGYEGNVVYVDTVDNRSGIAKPIESSRQPSGRTIDLHYLPGNPAHLFLGNTDVNQRVAFRHIGPPPNMDLTHSVDIITRYEGATVNESQGRVDRLQATPVTIPVVIPGLYYEAPAYTTSGGAAGDITRSPNGITLTQSAADGERALLGDDSITNLGTVGLHLDDATHTFDIEGSVTATLPDEWTRRALIMAPGVGYQWSGVQTNTTGAATTPAIADLVFTADEAFADAVIEEAPELYLAIWQYATARGALS